MKEVVVQESIRRWLKSLPFPVRVRKLADRFTRGYPDLQAFFVWKDRLVVLEIEVKRPAGGKLSALQRAEADDMLRVTGSSRYGVYVHCVARSVDDVKKALWDEGVDVGTMLTL